jgi:hypothetical protein
VRDGGALVVVDFETRALWFHGGRPDDTAARQPGHGVSRQNAITEMTAAGFRIEKEDPRWGESMWMLIFRVLPGRATSGT